MNTNRVLSLSLLVFCVLLAVVSFVPAHLVFWADSEIWAVAVSRLLFERSQDFDFLSKPLFHGALWLSHYLNISSFEATGSILPDLYSARLVMMLSQLLIFVSLLRLSYVFTRTYVAGLFAVSLLLASDFYFDQMFRIRSDLMAVPWVLLAVAEVFRGRHILRFFVLASIAFWMTPKAALFLVPAFATEPGRHFLGQVIDQLKLTSLKLITILLVLGLAILIQSRGLFEALIHFTNETKSSQMGFSYFSSVRWIYVREAITTDPWFWTFAVFPAALWIKRWICKQAQLFGQGTSDVLLLMVLQLVFLALNPSKLPFLIASYQPWVAFCIGLFLFHELPFMNLRAPKWVQISSATALVLILLVSVSSITQSRRNLPASFFHFDQEMMMQEFSHYLQAYPQARLYDGIGLSTDRPLSSFFIGPGQLETNLKFGETLREMNPSLVAYTQKTSLLHDQIDAHLRDSFIASPSGLYRRAMKITSQTPVDTDVIALILKAFPMEIYPSSVLFFELTPSGELQKLGLHQGMPLQIFKEVFPKVRLTENQNLKVTPYAPFESQLRSTFFDLFRFVRSSNSGRPQGESH